MVGPVDPMSVDGVRPVIAAGAPFLEVENRRWVHPSLILTRHDIVARIGFQLHHPFECFQQELYGRACVTARTPVRLYPAWPRLGRLALRIVYLRLLL